MFSNPNIPVADLQVAAHRPDILDAMQCFYAEVDRRIAAQNPTCWNRGSCCRFGEYGHRLYVTALEVAYYLSRFAPARGKGGRAGSLNKAGARTATATGEPQAASLQGPRANPAASSSSSLPVLLPPITADACPHAQDGRCHVRDFRPLGCRIFYCDPKAQHWQGPFTEQCLEELKRLHWDLGVPYFYADWMPVLREIQLCSRPTGRLQD